MVSADIAGEERVAKKEWRVQQHSSIAQAWEALQMTRSREKALEESMVTLENQLGVLNGVLVAQVKALYSHFSFEQMVAFPNLTCLQPRARR